MGSITKDKRYSINLEFCGYAEKRYVLRFCGDFIAQSKFYDTMLLRAIGHRAVLNGAEIITEIKGHKMDIHDKCAELYLSYLNEFLTLDGFASFYGLPDALAREILKHGEFVNGNRVKKG